VDLIRVGFTKSRRKSAFQPGADPQRRSAPGSEAVQGHERCRGMWSLNCPEYSVCEWNYVNVRSAQKGAHRKPAHYRKCSHTAGSPPNCSRTDRLLAPESSSQAHLSRFCAVCAKRHVMLKRVQAPAIAQPWEDDVATQEALIAHLGCRRLDAKTLFCLTRSSDYPVSRQPRSTEPCRTHPGSPVTTCVALPEVRGHRRGHCASANPPMTISGSFSM
jgi:hypothetical protein